MKFRFFRQENYKVSQWDGGTTKELAIFPETADYSQRDFLWRLSSATVEKEESHFSHLPDYDRVLMVIEGEVVLSYENQRVTRLIRLEQDRFDGGWNTTSFGKITDYNLMVRKGSEGYLDLIFPEKEKQLYRSTEESTKTHSVHTLYCLDGYAVVCIGDESSLLKAGEQLVIESEEGEEIQYGIMGEGTLIRGQIFYADTPGRNDESDEHKPYKQESGMQAERKNSREKATLDDFKLCIYLANVQFKWAKHIVKSLRNLWFDQQLSAAIRKVESFYITTIIFFAGLAAVTVLAASGALHNMACVAIAVAWILADCLLVSPAIYMLFVPKPVRKHMKKIDQLTPYEQKLREQEASSDSRTDRILKRYGGIERSWMSRNDDGNDRLNR